MRRNVLAYKAPPYNEGYDLICIHPNPQHSGEQVRVQVKSRYQTDCDRSVPVKGKSLGAFDYLVIVFLNNGFYYRKKPVLERKRGPEFFTLPADVIRENHTTSASGWPKVKTRNPDLEAYRDERGFELIARDLGIPYPGDDATMPISID